MQEISLGELSLITGLSVSHLAHLIRRKVLPPGRKEERCRMLPKAEALKIIEAHDFHKMWKPRANIWAQLK